MAASRPLLITMPQGYAWSGPTTAPGWESVETLGSIKVFTHLTILAPIQSGATCTLTLTVDPGSTNQSVNTWVCDLSGTGSASTLNGVPIQNAASQPTDREIMHIVTIGNTSGGQVRGYIGRLDVAVSISSPIPQVWFCAAWGTLTAPLNAPV